jgi:hypothetical protein
MKIIPYLFIFFIFSNAAAQDVSEQQINEIRKEFQKINSELESYVKKVSVEEIPYYYMHSDGDSLVIDGQTVIDLCKTYGYFNKNNELVLLTNKYAGEEGTWNDYQYYFKNEKVFFILKSEGDGMTETQERIYFYEGNIIMALIKRKSYDYEKDFKDIKNERYDFVMNNIEEQSQKYLKYTKSFIDDFYKGLKD